MVLRKGEIMKKLNYLLLFLGTAGALGQGYKMLTGDSSALPWLLINILVALNALERLGNEGW